MEGNSKSELITYILEALEHLTADDLRAACSAMQEIKTRESDR